MNKVFDDVGQDLESEEYRITSYLCKDLEIFLSQNKELDFRHLISTYMLYSFILLISKQSFLVSLFSPPKKRKLRGIEREEVKARYYMKKIKIFF